MTHTVQLHSASTELTEKLDTALTLAQEGLKANNRDASEATFNKVREIFKEFGLSNETQHFADSVVNASIDEAGGPLSKLKARSFKKVIDEIAKEKGLPRREIVGQAHNDARWNLWSLN